MIFFGRSDGWSDDDGWEMIEADSLQDAASMLVDKWDLDDEDAFSIIAGGERQDFVVEKKLVIAPRKKTDEDEGPDSQKE